MSNLLNFNHYSPAFRVLVLFIQNPGLELTSEEIRRKWPDLTNGAPVSLRLRHYRRAGMIACRASPRRLASGAKELTWSAGPALLEMLE